MPRKDKQRGLEYQRKWQRENPDKMREYQQRYAAKNKEKQFEANRKWREEHPNYRREYYEEKERPQYKQWICSDCGKDLGSIPFDFRTPKRCDDCRKKRQRIWMQKRSDQNNIMTKLRHKKDQAICIWHYSYGTYSCACCGYNQGKIFLDIDHINGNGNKHRKEIGESGLHRWLRLNNLPEGYQVLCCNCNQGKRKNGGICPHKEPQKT